MKYCQNCTRLLADDEVCPCTSQNAPQSGTPAPAVYSYSQEQIQNPPKKNNTAVIVVIVVAVLMLFVLPVLIMIPSMLGYIAKSNQSKINSSAQSIFDAYSTVIYELDYMDIDLGTEPFIICSDPSMNINVPFDSTTAYTLADKYFTDIEMYEYFVVINDGWIAYAACSVNHGRNIGTYPNATRVNEGPTTYSGSVGAEGWDLEDLYYYTCKEISLRP